MIKLHQITENIFAVEVPADANNFESRILNDLTEISFDDSTGYCIIQDAPIFEGNFKIIGTVTTDTFYFDTSLYSKEGEYLHKAIFMGIIKQKGIEPTNETKLLIIEEI